LICRRRVDRDIAKYGLERIFGRIIILFIPLGRQGGLSLLTLVLVLALCGPLRGSHAATPAEPAAADGPSVRPMTDAERQGAGCLASATTAMAVTYATAPTEMILLVVGGLVVPSNSSILFLGLFSTVAPSSYGMP